MNIRDSYIHGADGKGVVKRLFFATDADVTANSDLHVNDLVFLLADTLGTQVPLTIPTLNQNTTGYASSLLTVKSTSTSNHYLTFVDSNNTTADAESFYTSGDIYFKPSTGVLTVKSVTVNNTFNYAGIGSDTTSNAARKIWFASSSDGTPVVSDNFKYNPSTKTLTVDKISGPTIVIGNTTLYLDGANNVLTPDTVINNTSTDNTIPSSKAVWDAILTGIQANDAMVFKGFLTGGADIDHTAYTPGADRGDTYKVQTAGYINGEYYQVNDTFICTTDGTVAADSNKTTAQMNAIKANWGVVEGNGDYLNINGGTMYGTLSWDGTTALPTVTTASSILVVDSNTTKQISLANLRSVLGNYVPYEVKSTRASVDNTSSTPIFYNLEDNNLISGYHNYWYVINLGRYSGSQHNHASLIAMNYDASISDTDMFIRTAKGTKWRAWRRVLHDNNYTQYVYGKSDVYTKTESDDRYVNITGDTMTGHLKMGGTYNLGSVWDTGIIAGADGHDKVVISYLASTTNGATVGAHVSALNAWAALNISGKNLIFRYELTERMRMTNTGLGIGTATPSVLLLVVNSNNSYNTKFVNDSAASTFLPITDMNAPNITSGGIPYFTLGKASSSKNSAWIGYYWKANSDNANYLGLGIYSISTPVLTIAASLNVGIGTTAPGYKLHVVGDVYASGFRHSDVDSDNYVLLAGGGYKLLTDFLSSATNLTTVSDKTLTVDSWENMADVDTLDAGTYAIQINSGTLYASGIFTACHGTDLIIDEIPLHVSNTVATWRPYARISGTQLLMTTNEITGTSRTYTINIIKLI